MTMWKRRRSVGRRARWFLFFLAASISFLLALLVIGMWVRSCFVSDSYAKAEHFGVSPNEFFIRRQLDTQRGGITAGFLRLPMTPADMATVSPETLGWKKTQIATMQMQMVASKHVSSHWRRRAGDPSSPAGEGLPLKVSIAKPVAGSIVILIYAPWWVIVAALLLLPLLWIAARFGRQGVSKSNHCDACGYNLTGNTSGVCPECGVGISAEVSV